jgi:hypothetical protein
MLLAASVPESERVGEAVRNIVAVVPFRNAEAGGPCVRMNPAFSDRRPRGALSLREPSTVARARNFYLIVNADFTNSVTPFTVTGLPRNHDDE